MDSGELRDRVTIQTPGAEQDALGEAVPGWDDVATVWASVRDLTGREYLAALATQNMVQTKITMRFRADVLAAMRVVHGAKIYNIEAVLNTSGRRTYMTLLCSQGVAND